MSIFPTRILVATDGSREAQLAATTAADLANTTNSELHVVHVGQFEPTFLAQTEVEPAELEREAQRLLDEQVRTVEEAGGTVKEAHLRLGRADEEIQDEARRLLEEQVDEVKSAGGTVTRAHLRLGHPDEEIVGLGEEIGADLIVTGSRGLGGMRRALMGSASDSIVRHAHCPVMVVRPEKEQTV